MKALLHLSTVQITRLYWNAYHRMSAGDGYQPYGYDWRTLRLTKPGWYRTLRTILAAGKWKHRQEKRAQRRYEDACWKAGETLSLIQSLGL